MNCNSVALDSRTITQFCPSNGEHSVAALDQKLHLRPEQCTRHIVTNMRLMEAKDMPLFGISECSLSLLAA